ncbi:MAG TPA: hypothetical protein VG649_12870 [Candidatus Angelobacter sp.]|jgi:hypothetical protein|nr:hypothetical protein [Candidatus Angelobacter sp.]
MKSYWIAVLVAGVLTAGAAAQGTGASGASASGNASASAKASGNAGGNGANASSALSSGANVQAELTKSLDAKKAKAGDEVTAKVTQDVKSNGQVVVRKGSKLIGHVTEAKARSQGESESRLGIAFDKAVLKDGQEIPFNAVVQALAPAVNAAASADDSAMVGGSAPAPMPSSNGGGAPGGGMGSPVGAIGSTVGRTVGNTAGTVGGAAAGTVNGAGGALGAGSHGVIGMQGLTLNSAASGSAQGSVISSSSRNVKLDSGTQMVLQVNGSAQ